MQSSDHVQAQNGDHSQRQNVWKNGLDQLIVLLELLWPGFFATGPPLEFRRFRKFSRFSTYLSCEIRPGKRCRSKMKSHGLRGWEQHCQEPDSWKPRFRRHKVIRKTSDNRSCPNKWAFQWISDSPPSFTSNKHQGHYGDVDGGILNFRRHLEWNSEAHVDEIHRFTENRWEPECFGDVVDNC